MNMMCVEALSAMLQHAKRRCELTGILIARGKVRLNHLFFFADDSLFFCKANIKEWSNLQQVLDKYEQALEQRLNKEKTYIFFSRS